MTVSASAAVAKSVNDLADAIKAEDDEEAETLVRDAHERLSMLLDRGDLQDFEDRLRRYNAGARARVKISRGDSPRDQEEWVLEGEGETAEDARAEFEDMLGSFIEEWADDMRAFEPGGE